MRLRYAGTCRVCGADLEAKTEAIYDRSTKTVRCVVHDEVAQDVDTGTAGASARREFERRRQAREERVRGKHPRIGGFLLAAFDDPQSTKAWDTGAIGEERLGQGLDARASERVRLLHDRRIPGTRANVDHLAITPSGVWVIDAKRYRGRPRLKVEGGLFSERREKLIVGTRDCTRVVVGMHKQIRVVSKVVGEEVSVQGVLCFVEADWPLLDRGFSVDGVRVVRPKVLYPQLDADGPITEVDIDDLHRRLAVALPSA
jgi:hypothetical protein